MPLDHIEEPSAYTDHNYSCGCTLVNDTWNTSGCYVH